MSSRKQYDNITKLASKYTRPPLAQIILLDKDRQWLKSSHGAEIKKRPNELGFCTQNIHELNGIMIIEDLTLDMRVRLKSFGSIKSQSTFSCWNQFKRLYRGIYWCSLRKDQFE